MSEPILFRNRVDAAHRLAEVLKKRSFREPLILAIPRGGVVTGAVLASELNAELDVILARKLRAPEQPEFALGAIGEDGSIYYGTFAPASSELPTGYLDAEIRHQHAEIERRRRMIRAVRSPATIEGRSVIVTDDGIATGSTMIAALQTIRQQHPYQLLVAVPVVSPDRLSEIQHWCDEVIYLTAPDDFMAVGQFYDDFSTVEDDEVLQILRTSTTKLFHHK